MPLDKALASVAARPVLFPFSCTERSPKAIARRFDPATFLATAAKGQAISTHRKGKIFFAQEEATDAIFYIKKGKVKITVVSKQGKEAVVALLGADEFFGEGCLIGQPRRLATATAMTDCVTMRVETLEMQRALSRQPSFSRMFLSHVFDKKRPCRRRLGRPALQFN
jgi:CRP/FNR family cyclic AMP-dependent transcriptional regulator